jgi:hypothetical protein
MHRLAQNNEASKEASMNDSEVFLLDSGDIEIIRTALENYLDRYGNPIEPEDEERVAKIKILLEDFKE